MALWLNLNPELRRRAIRIHVVGAGGNGSSFISGLARMHYALVKLGHPRGIQATLIDPDVVTESNVGRQMFSPADAGLYKVDILLHRLNAFYGTSWVGECCRYREAHCVHDFDNLPDFVVGAVDSARSRVEIESHTNAPIWIDMGNAKSTGQVILGHVGRTSGLRVPNVLDLFPDLRKLRKEDNAPSCSMAEALHSQDLFINAEVSTKALGLLWAFLREGKLDFHGFFVDAKGMTRPMPICVETWSRLGYRL